jgi:hypothetical protein
MGVGTFSKERRIPQNYYNVHTGMGVFTRKVNEETQESIARQNKHGETIHELHVEYIVGKLVQVVRKDNGNFGVEFIFGIYDDVENAISSISFGYSNYLTRSAFNQICNLTPEDIQEKFIVFFIYQRPDKEKKDELRTWLQVSVVPNIDEAINGGPKFLYEHRLGLRFSKAELPEPTIVRDGGKDKRSYDDQMEFLWAEAERSVVPHVKNVIDKSASVAVRDAVDNTSAAIAPDDDTPEDDDPFPF